MHETIAYARINGISIQTLHLSWFLDATDEYFIPSHFMSLPLSPYFSLSLKGRWHISSAVRDLFADGMLN